MEREREEERKEREEEERKEREKKKKRGRRVRRRREEETESLGGLFVTSILPSMDVPTGVLWGWVLWGRALQAAWLARLGLVATGGLGYV